MNYQLRISDQSNNHLVVLSLDQSIVSRPAIDVIFDFIGADLPETLVASGQLAAGQADDMQVLKSMIFDRDADGLFVRDTISIKVNGQELDPDAPISRSFILSERDGMKYMRCDLVVSGSLGNSASAYEAAANSNSSGTLLSGGQVSVGDESSTSKQIESFSRLLFLHQVATGTAIDVTKEYPELEDVIGNAEREGLIEIDVKNVAYKLTEKGTRMHDSYIAEAQDLIKRFDIYGDVDVDSSGIAHFDTGLGRDLRVPAFEMEGVSPFRARFLLGLNDGEWDNLSNWYELFQDESWYRQIFAPIERSPSIEEIGREKLAGIMDQAKAILRAEQ